MSLGEIEALTLDTAGTTLDWYTGIVTVLKSVGKIYQISTGTTSKHYRSNVTKVKPLLSDSK